MSHEETTMAKRVMPSLDGLDAGKRPVLGSREKAELDNLKSPALAGGFVPDDDEDEPSGVAALFDTYE